MGRLRCWQRRASSRGSEREGVPHWIPLAGQLPHVDGGMASWTGCVSWTTWRVATSSLALADGKGERLPKPGGCPPASERGRHCGGLGGLEGDIVPQTYEAFGGLVAVARTAVAEPDHETPSRRDLARIESGHHVLDVGLEHRDVAQRGHLGEPAHQVARRWRSPSSA